MAVTTTSATARSMKESMQVYLNAGTTELFNRIYRGVEKVSKGKVLLREVPRYLEKSGLEPISDKANSVQDYASKAYHGGYNGCFEVGYFPYPTYDYDLKNAYPSAMCLVPDVDWEHPIRTVIYERELRIEDWRLVGNAYNPLLPFVAYIRFEFPENVKYPTIPVNVDGIPVMLRSSEGLDGVHAAGPEIYLALKLGARVYCETGYFLNTLSRSDGSESYSLRSAVKLLVSDRTKAKKQYGKGSLEELILKMMVNSGYGKTAQNVIQKTTWSAYTDEMEILGSSAITNPVSACLTTSIVRALLLAAQNQVHEAGYKTLSVTTDGFISDIPEDLLKSLDLYGFRPWLEQARLMLTAEEKDGVFVGGDPELWEIKHAQDDLVNFMTRGNISLHDGDLARLLVDENGAEHSYTPVHPYTYEENQLAGVCAHAGAKGPYDSDTYEDRKWMMEQVLSRTGRIVYTRTDWTTFRGLVKGKEFEVTERNVRLSLDFDMKRKPVRSSFEKQMVPFCGIEYEMAHFDTEAFSSREEYRLYRLKKLDCAVLRTMNDWEKYWIKIDTAGTGAKVRDLDWAKLNSCILGYRDGRWVIPALESGTVEEKCEFINRFNESGKKFKPSDWKNARRPERIATMLPLKMFEDLLEKMKNADKDQND